MEKKSGLYLFLSSFSLRLPKHWYLHFILTNEADVSVLACIAVVGQSDEKHVKTVIRQIFSFTVLPSSKCIKIHCVKLEVSTKFPAKYDTWHSWLHGLV